MKFGQLCIFFIIGLNALICLNNLTFVPFIFDGARQRWKKHKPSSTIVPEQTAPKTEAPKAPVKGNEQSNTKKIKKEYGVTWRHCAEEFASCQCSSRTIRFGKNDRWFVVKDPSMPEKMTCSLDVLRPNTEWKPKDYKQECWCEHEKEAKAPVQVALVTTSNRPYNMVTWLNYHLGYAGIAHAFIDLATDAQVWQSLLPSIVHRDRVTVYLKDRKDNYFLSNYQNFVVNAAINLSVRAGFDWLVHIDDDEMLYSPTKRSVGDIFAYIPDKFEALQMRNVEALYESPAIQNCFTETRYYNMNGQSYVAYANGKSAARLALAKNMHPRSLGVHTFARNGAPKDLLTLRTMEHNDFADLTIFGAPLLVVHMEGCPVSSWHEKYKKIAKTCEETKCLSRFIKNFPFQKKSVQRMMNCSRTPDDVECTQDRLNFFWSEYRVRLKRRWRAKDKIAPLDVPWDKIPGLEL